MKELDPLYIQLLNRALARLRDAALVCDLPRCRAEAEFLHNIPSLIGGSNVYRHIGFLQRIRVDFLEWAKLYGDQETAEAIKMFYEPICIEMAKILIAHAPGTYDPAAHI